MVDRKTQLENLKKELGNSYSEINKIKANEQKVIEENKNLLDKFRDASVRSGPSRSL